MEKLILKVPTIKCEGGVQNIQRVLTQRKGIAQVEGNPDTKDVMVAYLREEIGDEEIREAILQMGHQIG